MESTNPKDKIGKTKPPLHLIPPVANVLESMVMKSGAEKYGPYNWRDKIVSISAYVAAIERHLAAMWDGEDLDPESGQQHLAHIRANTGILLDAISLGMIVDDRPKKGHAAHLIRENTHTQKESNNEDATSSINWHTMSPHRTSRL